MPDRDYGPACGLLIALTCAVLGAYLLYQIGCWVLA